MQGTFFVLEGLWTFVWLCSRGPGFIDHLVSTATTSSLPNLAGGPTWPTPTPTSAHRLNYRKGPFGKNRSPSSQTWWLRVWHSVTLELSGTEHCSSSTWFSIRTHHCTNCRQSTFFKKLAWVLLIKGSDLKLIKDVHTI